MYAQEVSVERRERILEPAHTKAIYQLRRFVIKKVGDDTPEGLCPDVSTTEKNSDFIYAIHDIFGVRTLYHRGGPAVWEDLAPGPGLSNN